MVKYFRKGVMFVTVYVVCSIVWLILSPIFTYLLFERKKPYGTLMIDYGDPKKVSYLFEIEDLSILAKKKKIVLKIEHFYGFSQEKQSL